MLSIKIIRWSVLILLIITIISLLNWLFPTQIATKNSAFIKVKPAAFSTKNVDEVKKSPVANSPSDLSLSKSEKTVIIPASAPKTVTIKNIAVIEAMTGSVILLSNEFNFNEADDESKFAYLAALAQCAQFMRYAQQGYLKIIKETEQTKPNAKISITKQKQITNCQGAPVELISPVYSMLEKLALNTKNTEVSIQSDLLLSHLPNIQPSITTKEAQEDVLAHYKKQLMWLEHARQQGSLEAVLTLAIRYQYGEVPDPVTASSYYLTLQNIAPEYQLTDQVKKLTENLKTWQLTQAKQNSQLYLKQMEQLNTLYKW